MLILLHVGVIFPETLLNMVVLSLVRVALRAVPDPHHCRVHVDGRNVLSFSLWCIRPRESDR